MSKDEVISIIQQLEPGKEIESLVEFPKVYTYRMAGEDTGYGNVSAINKTTGKKENLCLLELNVDEAKRII